MHSRLYNGPPKYVQLTGTCVSLNGKEKLFAGVIKDIQMERLFWIIWVDPEFNYKCTYKGDLNP